MQLQQHTAMQLQQRHEAWLQLRVLLHCTHLQSTESETTDYRERDLPGRDLAAGADARKVRYIACIHLQKDAPALEALHMACRHSQEARGQEEGFGGSRTACHTTYNG